MSGRSSMAHLGLALLVIGSLTYFGPRRVSAQVLDSAPPAIRLWDGPAPGAVGDEDRDRPDVRVYLPDPEKATGAAVVICPGGGYAVLAYDHEGHQLARWFNSIGVAGIVLKYRLAPRYRHPAPLQDAQRALRLVRHRAEQYQIDPRRVGIMGFSAGGHLAATAATHFDDGKAESPDPVERHSSRPDFAVLCYAVISLTEPFGHTGSKRNLLGEAADPQLAENLSNEKQVTARTPPTFLFHTGDDTGVPAENSLAFYAALRRAKVPAELHVYQMGPHGIGLAPADPAVGGWNQRLADWMRANGFLSAAPRAAVKGTVKLNGAPLRRGMVALVPDDPNKPRAWAMVSNGQFSLPADRGPAVGLHHVHLYDLGAVEPFPTIDNWKEMRPGIVVDIQKEANNLEFQLGE